MSPTITLWHWPCGVCEVCETPPFILNSSPQFFRVSLLAVLMVSLCGKYSINMPLWSKNTDAMIFFTEMVIFQLFSWGWSGVMPLFDLSLGFSCIVCNLSFISSNNWVEKMITIQYMVFQKLFDDGTNFAIGSRLDRHVSLE